MFEYNVKLTGQSLVREISLSIPRGNCANSPQVLSSGSCGVPEGHGGRRSSIAEKSSVEPWPPGKPERRKCWQSWEVIAQEARHLCNRAKSTVTELPQSDLLFCIIWRDARIRKPRAKGSLFLETLYTQDSLSASFPLASASGS